MFWTVLSAVFLGVFLAMTLATMPDDVANTIFPTVLFFMPSVRAERAEERLRQARAKCVKVVHGK
jgi:hypothetical protein